VIELLLDETQYQDDEIMDLNKIEWFLEIIVSFVYCKIMKLIQRWAYDQIPVSAYFW
jgi:hypothetical protein